MNKEKKPLAKKEAPARCANLLDANAFYINLLVSSTKIMQSYCNGVNITSAPMVHARKEALQTI